MAQVICKICGVKFDREKEPAVLVSARRYAHAACAEGYEQPQAEKDLADLHKYLKELFKDEYDYSALDRQIKSYVTKDNFTVSGILKSLIYWYEVKGNTKEKSNNRIGIVPHIYKKARDYYYAVYLAEIANKDKDLTIIKKPKIIEIKIKKPTIEVAKFKLFDLDD